MKRIKKQIIKKEKPECSSQQEEHDLAYYIHDRVELMHQVFSMLKYKELKAMAPECVRNLAIGDLQELCTEELLGISSKRLLAILDGAEPPSDTESSSPSPPPDLETISLDSISSDEELLASSSKKKKHKHRHRNSKYKAKTKDKPKEAGEPAEENGESLKASRAGLTVLELLELQARARAIRAQLQQEQAIRQPSETTAVESSHHSTDNEVEIKEEPPDVVEISSEDEKPDVKKLQKNIQEKTVEKSTTSNNVETGNPKEKEPPQNAQVVTKRVNDLIITVPQAKPSRKIKLNRNNVTISVQNDPNTNNTATPDVIVAEKPATENNVLQKKIPKKDNDSKTKKKKKDKKKKKVEKDGSDHDEIMLQLSDSEKMDLLEDLDESRKNYDKVSSSSEDTESSSTDSEEENVSKNLSSNVGHSPANTDMLPTTTRIDKESTSENISIQNPELVSTTSIDIIKDIASKNALKLCPEISGDTEVSNNVEDKDLNEPTLNISCNDNDNDAIKTTPAKEQENMNENASVNVIHNNTESHENDKSEDQSQIVNQSETIISKDNDETAIMNENIVNSVEVEPVIISEENTNNESLLITISNDTRCVTAVDKSPEKNVIDITSVCVAAVEKSPEKNLIEITSVYDIPVVNDETNVENRESQNDKESEKDLSDGELSDRQSSEVEAIDVQSEVVCISDEESPKNKTNKKKKKKEKKSKKEKKTKKSKSDFREGADQNFYKDADQIDIESLTKINIKSPIDTTSSNDTHIHLDSDEVYEIMELSDDSSCYEVEGTVLSKEPTAEEIEALSARIDEIDREEVVTDEQIRQHEAMLAEKEASRHNVAKFDGISWKDRYLESNKVKKVLTTSNILNALRKKNKELKKKIQDSKNKDVQEIPNEEKALTKINNDVEEENKLEEGSIQQYNTLEGSTKYVNPVKEIEHNEDTKNDIDRTEKNVAKEVDNLTKEMKKDAKQLLKMYKKLLKHNDMNKMKDPNKKKKKKKLKKNHKELDSSVASESTK